MSELAKYRSEYLKERVEPLAVYWCSIFPMLAEWQFQFNMNDAPLDDQANNGCIDRISTRHYATITFRSAIVDDPEELEWVLVHELLHILLGDITDLTRNKLGSGGADEWYTRLVEVLVDRLTSALIRMKNAD